MYKYSVMYLKLNYLLARNFHWIKILPSPATFACIKGILDGINFHQCGKGCYILYIMHSDKNLQIKISPMRAGGKIDESFLLVKIPAIRYCIILYYWMYNSSSLIGVSSLSGVSVPQMRTSISLVVGFDSSTLNHGGDVPRPLLQH